MKRNHFSDLKMSKAGKRVQIQDDAREPLLPITGSTDRGQASISSTKKQTNVPKRTTKTSQKLTLFPEGLNETLGSADYKVLDDPLLPHVSAKTQKERWLSKLERKWLPRVTAYCTAKYFYCWLSDIQLVLIIWIIYWNICGKRITFTDVHQEDLMKLFIHLLLSILLKN
jgi:hypothetical protein